MKKLLIIFSLFLAISLLATIMYVNFKKSTFLSHDFWKTATLEDVNKIVRGGAMLMREIKKA